MRVGEMAEANPPRSKMRFRRNAVRALLALSLSLPAVLKSLVLSSGMRQHGALAQTAEWGVAGPMGSMEACACVDCGDALVGMLT